jgi:hypothetical protein
VSQIVLTESEQKALEWFLAHFNLRKGTIHTQHRRSIASLLKKIAEALKGPVEPE